MLGNHFSGWNHWYTFVATELPKTEEEFEERLIFKSFFLKSMNAFAPIFYVAFFKGRLVSPIIFKQLKAQSCF